jgi:hypothetical protein
MAYAKARATNYNFDGLFRRVNVIYIQEGRRSLFTYDQLGVVNPTDRSICEKIVLGCQVAVSVEFLGKGCTVLPSSPTHSPTHPLEPASSS